MGVDSVVFLILVSSAYVLYFNFNLHESEKSGASLKGVFLHLVTLCSVVSDKGPSPSFVLA